MPRKTAPADLPPYRLHRARNAACVDLFDAETGHRRRVYLGKHGAPESHRKYLDVIREWEDAGRVLDGVAKPTKPKPTAAAPGETVGALLLEYWKHEKARRGVGDERAMGGHDYAVRTALRVCRRIAGRDRVDRFGPLRLQEVREAMVAKGWTRSVVNRSVGFIVMAFRWGVTQERVPAEKLTALQAVRGLRAGEMGVPEGKPRKPVPVAHVEQTKPFLPSTVRAVVELALLTGARCGELLAMRPRDLDTTGTAWVYTPPSHKTQHHGHAREIFLGPRAQQVVTPFLNRRMDQPMFTPSEAMAERAAEQREARKSHPTANKSRDERRRAHPQRSYGGVYTGDSLRRCITRACDRAGVPRWTPHQLRHTAATQIRREHGLEAAALILGHSSAVVTDSTYAERDRAKIESVIAQVG